MKEKLQLNNVAIIRIEQLYPFPEKQLNEIINKYDNALEYHWAQEEPKNMGAWSFIFGLWNFGNIICHSREASASPASGSSKVYDLRQRSIIDSVFNCIENTNNKQ